MGWIRNQFVNKYNQMPIKNMNFIIKSYNGQELHGKTDENGYINIENIDFTKYKIIFKDNE